MTKISRPDDSIYDSVRAHVLGLVKNIDHPVRVREEELAKKLSVSRTPVREALLRLGQEGILTMEPRRGALLSPVTLEDYIEWLKLRIELEAFAAREAALNASQRDVDALRAIFAPFNDDNIDARIDEYAAANVEFHAAVIRLAENSLLGKVWKSFGHRAMLKTRTIERLKRARHSLAEHRALIDAIEKRDGALADRLAREHVQGLLAQTLNDINNTSTGDSI
ncbi:GntR family transcriptional regulator [Candidimonas sp. SYP-B2681]|nr:GntR family transcriptional regulator [Candidimonas sp. SYP-B2681]